MGARISDYRNRRESDADDEEYHDGLYTGATSPPRDRVAVRRAPARNLSPNEIQAAADAEPAAWDPGPSPSWHFVWPELCGACVHVQSSSARELYGSVASVSS